MKYFPASNTTYAYDPKIRFLTKIDNNSHLVSLTHMINPTISNSRALAADINSNILFVNTDEFEITAFGDLEKDTPRQLFIIENISKGQSNQEEDIFITDMKCLSQNRLVTLTSDGKISLYTYSNSAYSLVNEFDLKSDRTHLGTDSYVSLGVDSTQKLDMLCVSSKDDSQLNNTLGKMMVLEIGSNEKISVVSQYRFENQVPDSLVYDLGIIRRKGQSTQFYGFQNTGQRNLIILSLIGKELVEIDSFDNFHKDQHGMSEFKEGCLHAVEATGTLRILKLA